MLYFVTLCIMMQSFDAQSVMPLLHKSKEAPQDGPSELQLPVSGSADEQDPLDPVGVGNKHLGNSCRIFGRILHPPLG